jgi:hypothetical protein
MAVIQEAFDIPADIMTKLLTGEYRRIGGVVRYAVGPHKGQIVKHLKPVDMKAAEQAQGVGAQIMKFAKKNKKGLIIGAAVAGAATVGGIIYHKVKNREPAVVAQFRAALRTYIDEIRKGNLELETIETLMAALDKLKAHKDYEQFKIRASSPSPEKSSGEELFLCLDGLAVAEGYADVALASVDREVIRQGVKCVKGERGQGFRQFLQRRQGNPRRCLSATASG